MVGVNINYRCGNMKKFNIDFEILTDDEERKEHRLSHDGEYLFSASEACAVECPEDNYFYRGLFSGDSYLDAVRLGMKLVKEGYEDLEINIINKEY